MFVDRIILKDFRNYEALDIGLKDGFNVFCGNNGQGKTNILEAVFFCAIGRSFRYGKDADLVRNGSDAFQIGLSIGDDVTDDIRISYKNTSPSGNSGAGGNYGEKSVRVNGLYLRKLGHLMGNLLSVIFSPEDLEIVNEGPSVRRKLLDIVISQLSPDHYFDLQQYLKTVSQKNALLRDYDRMGQGARELLDVYNEQAADTGSRITFRRWVFSRELEKYAAEKNLSISRGEALSFKYYSNFYTFPEENDHETGTGNEDGTEPGAEGLRETGADAASAETVTAETIKKDFLLLLNSRRSKEIERGHSLYGPQYDDLLIFLNGTDLKRFGSQGQKRTAVLSIKLAETELLYRRTGRRPVLLLDDVFSELDEGRSSLLLDSAGGFQTLITTANLSELPPEVRRSAKIFFVKSGRIS
jgi:DNA replication and repair protein RecF